MILNIQNLTAVQRSYLSGAVTLPASSMLTVTANYIYPISRDSMLVYDCQNGNVTLNDGVNIYSGTSALDYLNEVASSLGGAVVGYVGSSTPSFAITVGGQDPNGNVQVGHFDTNGNLMTLEYSTGPTGSAVPSDASFIGGKNASGSLIGFLSGPSSGLEVEGTVASGYSDSGNGIKTAAVASTNIAGLPTVSAGQRVDNQADLNGRIYVNATPVDGARQTYSAAKVGLAPGNTDIFTIAGSSSKTIRVTRVEISFTQSIYNNNDIVLIKRSAANSGGTSTSITAVPHDSSNSAATASVLAYTANPSSLGAAVGTIRAAKLFGQATNEPYAGSNILVWDFGNRPSQAIVLRGTTQVLAVNLNSSSISGASFDISIEWTEE